MRTPIALGFQNTVDFELTWDARTLEQLILRHHIQPAEIQAARSIQSERDLLLVLLGHMIAGTGSERTVASSAITRGFAAHFPYTVTLGGTAVRAAIAMAQIGYHSTVHACSLNHYFRDLLPDAVQWMASVPDEGEEFHPHVIVQYPAGAHIHAGDVRFTTPRPNRVIFAHDPPSEQLAIHPGFASAVCQAQVFLAASYNVIREESILRQRLETTLELFRALPRSGWKVMEDACFQTPRFRQVVTDALGPHLNLFSLNEDELQDRAGTSLDLLDPQAVARAIVQVQQQVHSPLLVCHTAHWVLAYGAHPEQVRPALQSGIAMAATRFRLGDRFHRQDFQETLDWPDSPSGAAFAQALAAHVPSHCWVCLPGKDLSSVPHPTTIGLGDAFIGGMLPALLVQPPLP